MMPIVWFVGTSGVGKSTIAWELQQALSRADVTAAFVDTDQLRNVGGVEVNEETFIVDGLRALTPAFRAAGSTALIVAGMVDDEEHFARLLPVDSRSQVFVVHLHASDAEIVDRVEKRKWNVELAAHSVEFAHGFDANWTDLSIDTTDRAPSEVAELVLERLGHLFRSADPYDGASREPWIAGRPAITLVTGPGGVGLSTTGFLVFLQGLWAGQKMGYVDSDQVGFIGKNPRGSKGASLRAENAKAVAAVMAGHGIERVVITADPFAAYALLEITDSARIFWLDASDTAIEARLRARAEGGGPPLAGDRRRGLDERRIREALVASVTEARDESLRPDGAIVIDTGARTADEVAALIAGAS